MSIKPSNPWLYGVPWALALLYLIALGMLSWQFHLQRDYKITELTEILTDGQSQKTKLGMVRRIDTGVFPFTFEHKFVHQQEQPLALFLPRYASDVDIHLNGISIREHDVSYLARHSYWPTLVQFPNELLQSNNQLKITLLGYSRVAALSQFYLGPRQQLEPLYKQFYFWRVTFMQWTCVVAIIVALFMGTIWLVRRQLSEYGWVALAFASISIHLAGFVRISEPLFSNYYYWTILAVRALFIITFIVFTHKILHLNRPRLERWIAALFAIIFALGLGFVIAGNFSRFVTLELLIGTPLILILLAYISWCFLTAINIRHNNKTYLHWFLVSGLCALVLGFHDVLVVLDVQHPLVRDFYLAHYAISFTAIGYGGVMVHRMASALLNSQELNTELRRQVDKKTSELETAAENKLLQDKKLLLYDERQRIMADMHDGVGGQLVNLLAANRGNTLSQNEINQELDLILADLRLVLDALTPSGEELIAALARLKERYTSLLKHANIQLHWDVDINIDAIRMPPSLTINILRLMQEAIQNSIKHARASNISLQLVAEADGYSLSITDDGIGMTNTSPGHGTKTMQQRALAINGKLQVSQPSGGGTQVKLTFPAPLPAP